MPEWARLAATGVLFAAILMPLGFFLSVLGRDPQRPNAWRWSIWAGAPCWWWDSSVPGSG
ncbi:hypothetical protein [Granulicoccus sp. GXG6511]|uniref:hypothetical protein n=1 Tax=Granulicoccus sp. GXG6511 TaxID=3381351 RepID=UPI003D7CABCC